MEMENIFMLMGVLKMESGYLESSKGKSGSQTPELQGDADRFMVTFK